MTKEQYWLIPPDIYETFDKRWHFDYDPCPYPRPEGYDGLTAEWGRSNWVNPLFKGGPTAWVRKCIEEAQKGKTVVLIYPLDNWVKLCFDSYARIVAFGHHEWVDTETGKSRRSSRPSFLFIWNDP